MITLIRAYPVYPKAIHVEWELDNQSIPGDYRFIVSLLIGEEVAYSTGVIYNCNSTDLPQSTLQSKDLRAYFSISVKVIPPILDARRGLQEETKVVPLYPTLNKADFVKAQTIVRKEQLRFKVKIGNPFKIFKRKLYGPLCPVCTDPITRHSKDSKCLTCYGTSLLGGYWPPVDLFGELEEGPMQKELTQVDTTEEKKARVRLDNTILLSKKDLIYDAIHGRIFQVIDDVALQTFKAYPISQITTVSEVSPKNIVYKLLE